MKRNMELVEKKNKDENKIMMRRSGIRKMGRVKLGWKEEEEEEGKKMMIEKNVSKMKRRRRSIL